MTIKFIDDIDIKMQETRELKDKAKVLTEYELLETTPKINHHIVSLTYQVVKLENIIKNKSKPIIDENISYGGTDPD